MRISLKPAKGDKFVFSLMPETIQAGYAAKCQSFDLISRGTVRVPKGTEVPEISWSGEFFGASRKKLTGVDQEEWKNPKECVKTRSIWKSGSFHSKQSCMAGMGMYPIPSFLKKSGN